jgi:hypothetical protein
VIATSQTMPAMGDEHRVSVDNTFASPLHVEMLDAASRKLLRDYLQARLVSYHEDENGQPTSPPPNQRTARSCAAKATTGPLRRPARGLVTLCLTPGGPDTQRGVNAVLEISAEGNLTMWGGTNFDEVLLQSPLCKLSVHFSEDTAQSRTFVLSVANKTSVTQNPAIYCFVRDRSKWLAIFRRRGVTPLVGGPAGA